MRILLVTAGSRGDVEPFVALARRAAASGHTVLVAAPDRSSVDTNGIDVRSLGVDFSAMIESQGVSPVAAMRNLREVVRPVMRGVIVAPPKDHLILPGITYGAAYEFAREAGLPFEMRPVSRAEVLVADEMWLSSSTKEVVAVTTMDGRPFASGAPGPMFRKMHALFQEHKPH